MDTLYLSNMYGLSGVEFDEIDNMSYGHIDDVPPSATKWNVQWRIMVDNSLLGDSDDLFWSFVHDEDPYSKLKREFERLEWERVILYLLEGVAKKIDECTAGNGRKPNGKTISQFMCGPTSPRYSSVKSPSKEIIKMAIYGGKNVYYKFMDKRGVISPEPDTGKFMRMILQYNNDTGLEYDDILHRSTIRKVILDKCQNE